ncbi:phosphotransferase [Paenibacillus cymbidii]|uniref:phosphotransferase n=1 Tax=Paenibacillus cymbidii TaxID=1639034 RepID=UPI0014367FF8|nr:phosphotransferase [Paenibacillus cymbidii]
MKYYHPERYKLHSRPDRRTAIEKTLHLQHGLNKARIPCPGAMDFQQFESSKIGWLHWDLWVDNLLVHERGLAGIVDFDRMMTAYPEIDVARAILSGALQDGQLRMETVQAFMSGYREHSEAPEGVLSRAMSMLYLIESIWWYRTEVRAESALRPLLGRFIEEMHWLEDHFPTEQLKGIS